MTSAVSHGGSCSAQLNPVSTVYQTISGLMPNTTCSESGWTTVQNAGERITIAVDTYGDNEIGAYAYGGNGWCDDLTITGP